VTSILGTIENQKSRTTRGIGGGERSKKSGSGNGGEEQYKGGKREGNSITLKKPE